MKKEFNQEMFSEFKESVVSERQRIINIIAPSNMMMVQTLTENKANNFIKECTENNISVELNINSHESIENFMDYIAHLYHAKGLALEDIDEPTVNDMVKYYHICQCDAAIYQNDEATDEELFNDFGVVPLDMLNDEKLKEYKVLFEAFEKYVAYYNKEDKSELLYDLCKQKRKQSVKVDENIRQIMCVLLGSDSIDEEYVTSDGNLIFRDNYYEKSVEFCGKDGEYYHFIIANYEDGYDEDPCFVKIENGAAYTDEGRDKYSLLICFNKTENGDFYIKNGTEYIYDSAFKDCNFNNVIVPNSVRSISKEDFLPSNIKKITLKSRGINVYDKEDEHFIKIVNFEKSELESLIKEDGSLVIPDNITEIPDSTFRGCKSLTSVVIHDGVTSIGRLAFDECSGLTSITIPVSVASIGEFAFHDCDSLTKVNYTGTIDQWSQINFYDHYANPLCRAANLYINDMLVTEVNLTTATKISDYAFYNCSSLISVTIGDGVISIGTEAFKDCSSLTSIIIPNSVISIGYWAFENCNSLTSIEIPDSVTSIGGWVFKKCSSLTSIKIPNGVTDIKDGMFSDCNGLTSVTIPNSVTSIKWYAFFGCSSLTSVVIPNSVTSIDREAFYNCSSLTSVVIPDSVTSIGEFAFSGCRKLENVVIPDSVKRIDYGAFNYCDLLKHNFNE